MNILITGGSGLLGSEINIDNALKPSSKELNLLDYSALKNYIELYNVSKIIHCAAKVGGVQENMNKNFDFLEINTQMNINVLRACKEFNLNNSVFILSTCVMPDNVKLPYIEDSLHMGAPHNGNYGYAYSKRLLEIGSRSLKEQYGVNTICLIPCNLYGKNDNFNLNSGHVIPSLIHKCFLAKQNSEDFLIWGTGMSLREFIFVEDFARIIEQIVNSDQSYETMIVSSGVEYSIRDIASIIANHMNYSGKLKLDLSKPDGIYKKTTSNKTFLKYFSNHKWTDIHNGISVVVDYFIKKYPAVRL